MSALPVTPLAIYKKLLSTLEQCFIGDQWTITDLHSVDNLSREECIQWLARVGLSPAQKPQPVYERPIQHNEASEQSLVDAFSQSLRDNGLEDFPAAPPQALSSLENQQQPVLAAPRQSSLSPIPPRRTRPNRYATNRSAPYPTRSRSKRLTGAAEAAQRNSILNGIVTMGRGTGRGRGRGGANGKGTGKAKEKTRPIDIVEENENEDVKMESPLPPQIEQWTASVVVVVDNAHHPSPAPVPALALASPVASSSLLPLSTPPSAAAPPPILPTQSNIPAPTELVQRTVRVIPKHEPYTIPRRSERIAAQRGGVPAHVPAAPVIKTYSKRKAAKKAAKQRVVEPNAEAGPSRTCHRGGTPVIASIMDVEVDINIDIAQLNRERIVTLSTPSEAVLAHTPTSAEPVPLTSSPLVLQTTPVIAPVQPPATTTAHFPCPANPTVTYGSDTDALPYPSPIPHLITAHLPSRLKFRSSSSSSSSDMMEPLELEYPSPSTAVYGHQSTAPQYLNVPSLIPVATRVMGSNLYTMHPIGNDGVGDQLDKEKDQQPDEVKVKEEEEDQLDLDQKVLRILTEARAMADEKVRKGADIGDKPVADANQNQHASTSSRRSRGPSAQSRRPKRYNPYERTRGNSADAYSSPSPTCSVPPASNTFFNARPRSLRSRQKRRRHDLGVLEEIREAEAEVDGDDEDEGDYAPERDEVERTVKHKLEGG